jgi:uncharacterized membrane protein YesL
MARLSGRCPVHVEGYHRPRETTIDTPSDPLTPAPPPDRRWAAPDPNAPDAAAPDALAPGSAAPEPVATSWVTPEPPPIAASRWGGWTPPPDERTITVGGVIGEAWGTYKGAFGPLLLMGTVIGLLLILLSLPTEVYTVRMYDALIRVIVDFVNTRATHSGISDPVLLEDQILAIANMPLSTAIIFAITAGLTTGLGILGSCVLTAAALTARAGRRVSPSGSVMAVLARGSALVVPAVLLAAGSAIVTLAVQLNSGSVQRSDLTSTGGTNTAQTALTIAAIVIAAAIFYLSVRWGLAIAAILVEDVSLREGLRRSSRLTRGHRLRLAAIVIVVGLLQGLTVTLPALVLGLTIGFNAGSISSGIISFALAAIVGSAVWAPFSPAVAAVAYRRLADGAVDAADAAAGTTEVVAAT